MVLAALHSPNFCRCYRCYFQYRRANKLSTFGKHVMLRAHLLHQLNSKKRSLHGVRVPVAAGAENANNAAPLKLH